MKKTTRKRKFIKLNRYEKALICLAEYMERDDHDQFRIKLFISDILGIEEIK